MNTSWVLTSFAAFWYVKGAYKQERSQLFERVDNSRTTGNVCKLKEGRFRLDVRGKFFTRRVVRCWNRLPREGVDVTVPGGVQGQVGWGPGQPGLVLNVEVGGPACSRGVGDWVGFDVPPNLRHSMILNLCHISS